MQPSTNPYGKSYGDWSTAWWQYVISVPAADNPLLDQTGVDCGVQQSGPVFFLGGLYAPTGTVSVHRTQCHVPAGKALFFPIVNAFCKEPDFWTDYCQTPMDQANDLRAEIDGKKIHGLESATASPYRAESHGWSYTAPANNIFGRPDSFTNTNLAGRFLPDAEAAAPRPPPDPLPWQRAYLELRHGRDVRPDGGLADSRDVTAGIQRRAERYPLVDAQVFAGRPTG